MMMNYFVLMISMWLIAVPVFSADPGESTVISVCTQASEFELFDALQGSPDTGGEWTDPDGIEVSDGIFVPGESPEGVYTYTVDVGDGPESATVEIMNVDCGGPPANNACSDAQFINPANNIPFSTFGATTDGLPHFGIENCEVDGQTQIENDVWYLYLPDCDGTATFSTVGGTTLDTKIAVYSFACPPTTDDLLGCNEDFGAGYQSSVNWEIESGQVYLIRLGESPGPGSGNGTFNLTEICAGEEPPVNQFCEDATVVFPDPAIAFSTINAATDGPDHDGDNTCTIFDSGVIANDVWFSYTATCEGTAIMSTLGGTTLDTRVAVYAEACPEDLSNLVACNDDYQGFGQSQVAWDVSTGDQFLLRLGNPDMFNGGSGTFSLVENCGDLVPENDDCSQVEAISPEFGIPFNTMGATTDGPSHFENLHCTFFGGPQIDKDVWYEYTASCDGIAEVSTVNGTFLDTRLAVYAEYCPEDLLNLIVCNDDADGETQSTVEWNVVAGDTYIIRLGEFPGAGGGSGTFNLTETCTEVCAMPVIGYQTICNGLDDFESYYVSATVVTMGNSAPYQISPSTGDDAIEISETGEYVFGPFANNSPVFFTVESLSDESCVDMSYELSANCYPDNYNFTCGDVFQAFTNQYTSYTNVDSFTWGDTLDTEECGFGQIHNDLWYVYTASCTGEVTWSNCAFSDFDSRMAVYENTCEGGDLELVACSEPDDCGEFSSTLTFSAFQGGNYVLRLGSTSEDESGNGVFIIEEEIELVTAGQDTTVQYCTDITGTVLLNQVLGGEDSGGNWIDADTSDALLGNVLVLGDLEGPGTYHFDYQVAGPCNDDVATVTVVYDICDGISQEQESKRFQLFPNPANSYFSIGMVEGNLDVEMELYDVSGRSVMIRSFHNQGSGVVRVNVNEGIPAGIYFVRLQQDETGYTEIHKLIIK